MSNRTRLALALAVVVAAALVWWLWSHPHAADDATEPEDALGLRSKSPLGRSGEAERDAGGPPWGDARASISGTVTAGGRPIVAQVCAVPRGAEVPHGRTEPRCTKSSAVGRYRIDDLDPVQIVVGASAPTFVAGSYREGQRTEFWLAAGQEKRNVDIVLEPGGVEVRGVVRDISGGEIEGATVNSAGWWGRSGFAVARTDERGAFTLWVKPGSATLTARAEGYADGGRSGAAPGFLFEIYLTPESVLVGRVVQAGSNDPVAGAKVFVGEWGVGVAYADESGRFRIAGLEPGRYKPTARTDTGWGQASDSVHVGLGETSDEIVIELHPAALVRAKLVIADSEGAPCAEGSGSLVRVGGGGRQYVETKPGGVLEWQGVLAGTYRASAWCRDHLPEDDYGEIEVAGDPITDLVWEVKRGRAIRGRVVGPDGEPVPDASVGATMTSAGARAQRSDDWGSEVQPDGTFEVAGLLPGSYELRARADDFPATDKIAVEVPADRDVEDVVIELKAAAKIVGRVVDGGGEAVSGCRVTVEGPQRANASSDDAGHFELDGLEAGDYRVKAQLGWTDLRRPGSTDDDVQGEAVSLDVGEVEEIELVVEARAGEISGRVVDEAGGPIADAFINAERESDSQAAAASRNVAATRWGGWNRKPVLTDQDGGFTLGELSEGRYTLRAYRKGGGEGFLEHVEVGSTGVVVAIDPTGTIEGRVVVSGGTAPERFEVNARVRASGFDRDESYFRTDGVFVLDELPPGKFEIVVESEAGTGNATVELAEGGTKAGLEIELTHRVTVKGKLVDIDSGAPVPGMAVQLAADGANGSFSDFGGGGERKHVSDESGVFEIAAAPVGEATLMAIARDFGDGEYSFARCKVTVPDENPAILPDIELVKRRVPRDGRKGDLGFTLKQAEAGVDRVDRPLVVGFVRPGGPAASSGLAAGDTIVTVDTHDVTGKRSYLYGPLTEVPQGTSVELGLAGDRTATIVAGAPL